MQRRAAVGLALALLVGCAALRGAAANNDNGSNGGKGGNKGPSKGNGGGSKSKGNGGGRTASMVDPFPFALYSYASDALAYAWGEKNLAGTGPAPVRDLFDLSQRKLADNLKDGVKKMEDFAKRMEEDINREVAKGANDGKLRAASSDDGAVTNVCDAYNTFANDPSVVAVATPDASLNNLVAGVCGLKNATLRTQLLDLPLDEAVKLVNAAAADVAAAAARPQPAVSATAGPRQAAVAAKAPRAASKAAAAGAKVPRASGDDEGSSDDGEGSAIDEGLALLERLGLGFQPKPDGSGYQLTLGNGDFARRLVQGAGQEVLRFAINQFTNNVLRQGSEGSGN